MQGTVVTLVHACVVTLVLSEVIPGTGHWVAEEARQEVLAALTPFLAPYRDQDRATRPRAATTPGK
ncbi:hypothetical protein ACFZCP_19830 [Streptomyces sp. NPDC007971]|uniref:hypothetical protein n=1 Tax=Streptomyces sp. NPDC007971 TaxID=3364799 RepID=UPI0036E2AAAE